VTPITVEASPAILLAEDDPVTRMLMTRFLKNAGYEVDAVANGSEALDKMTKRYYPMLVTDWEMPEMDGIALCKAVRNMQLDGYVYALLLTARDAKEHIIAGLEAGADDYLVKPFAFAELVARIAALARRAAGPRWAPVSDVPLTMRDDLVIESGGRTVALSPREYALFGCLLRRRGEVVARAEILRDAFGYEFDPGTNVIDVHLNHLRKNKTPVTIFLVNGVKLQGIVTWFDNFSVLLRRDGHSQLVYKHAISTIMPVTPVQLFDGDKADAAG